MPSTVVHLAIGTLVGAALIDEFDERALGVVLLATALPDLDTFIGIWLPGTHRAALHTLVVPVIAAGCILYDTRYRDESRLAARGARWVGLAWAGVAAYAIGGIGPDLFFNGANVFYPLHDRFYSLNGRLLVSNQRGLVQTFWEVERSVQGTTATVHYTTGVDVERGPDPANVERVFPIVSSGLQALLVIAAVVVATVRVRAARRRA